VQNEKGSDGSGEFKAFKSHRRHLMASISTVLYVLSNDGYGVIHMFVTCLSHTLQIVTMLQSSIT
jgi:hypothetical protein